MLKIKIEPGAFPQAMAEIGDCLPPLPESRHAHALLICEEILTNQIRHADFGDTPPEITLEIARSGERQLGLLFQDNAQPFNPLEHPAPDQAATLEECTPGGLGIYLVRQYARSLDYRYVDGKNVLEVIL